ncbi:TIGR03546 family protein [Thalassotalea sp. HSM 43]|uniref:TIGR03546 family protein n=1 Tax=Thalassotalea sp. HSM 43 TaxID=2552945 RepID=UPI00108167E8|nr:TIGR03546 family protein [Thalassotalea sp. HSM 43]QBY03603.1 TIGR03546 family protein [Thalassotalea sp. HSM 43]
MLTLLAKFFKALNSESSPRQIALAVALGMIVGLTPTLSLHNVLLLLIAFLLRINLSAFFVSIAVFSILSLLLATPMALLGDSLLLSQHLQAFWQSLYQVDVLKLAHFHNTLTLGSLVSAIIAFIPVYFLATLLVQRYRHHMMQFIERFKVVQMLKGSRFYKVYQSLSGEGSL